MKCPYCNKRMQVGMIQSHHELRWIKGSKKVHFNRKGKDGEDIVLSEMSFLSGSSVSADLCRYCGRIIVDLKKEGIDWKQENDIK